MSEPMHAVLSNSFTIFRIAILLWMVIIYPYLGAAIVLGALGWKILKGGEIADLVLHPVRSWKPWMTAIGSAIVIGFAAAMINHIFGPIFSWIFSGGGFEFWIHSLAVIPMAIFIYDPTIMGDIASGGRRGKPLKMAPSELSASIKQHIFGQDDNIDSIASLIVERMAKPRDRGPVGTFMLAGPTGTGKTETARLVAAYLGLPMFVVRCNEYSNKWGSVERLIGSQGSYKNSEQGGELTNALISTPRGVLVLDEIEKADESVAKVLMTLLDEGTITTAANGTVVNAQGWIMFATTNAAHEEIARITETAKDIISLRIGIKDALKAHWPPEILGRFDRVLAFRRVTDQDDVAAMMVNKALASIFSRLDGVVGEMTPEASNYMISASQRVGKYGFRELERYLEEVTTNGLAGRHHGRSKRKPLKIEFYVESSELRARVIE